MKMVNLKRTAADKAAETKRHKAMGWDNPPEPHDYPQGARVNLGEGELEKLGIKKLPKAGDVFTVTGKVRVVTVHSESEQGKDPTERLELQITHLGMESARGAAEQMYDRTPQPSDDDGDE